MDVFEPGALITAILISAGFNTESYPILVPCARSTAGVQLKVSGVVVGAAPCAGIHLPASADDIG